FNKAHTAGYGLVSFWTAYLKANFPAEYMAAQLTSVRDNRDKMGTYLNDCRHQGISVLPPDVNESFSAFAAVGEDIRFGLNAVRNVGWNVVEGIIEARTQKGKFTSFGDFLKKVPPVVCNKRTIESLIKAGAFDSLGHTRRALFDIFEEAVDAEIGVKKNEAMGQVDLFGSLFGDDEPSVVVPNSPEWSKKDKLAFEREMLGLYVSDHPLAGHERTLAKFQDKELAEIVVPKTGEDGEEVVGGLRDGDIVSVAGLITSVQQRVARASGKPWALVSLEDFSGQRQVMFMGRTYLEFADRLVTDQVVAIKGRLRERDDEFSISAQSIQIIDVGAEADSPPVHLNLPAEEATREVLLELDRILRMYSGSTEVFITLTGGQEDQLFALPRRVAVGHEFFGEIKALLGKAAIGATRAAATEADSDSADDFDGDETGVGEPPPLHEDAPPPEDYGY
ncbi:MAG: OB-fold nucleic acid binding domain-containing protein, partial [Micrococcales bacterium]